MGDLSVSVEEIVETYWHRFSCSHQNNSLNETDDKSAIVIIVSHTEAQPTEWNDINAKEIDENGEEMRKKNNNDCVTNSNITRSCGH